LAFALVVATALPASAAKPHYEVTGRVVAIAYGDTLAVLDGSNTRHKIRLAGVFRLSGKEIR
jgi:endonuclease YncB( thermonuclease family)